MLLTFVPCPAPRSYFSYTPSLCHMTTSEPILLLGPFVDEKTSSVRGEVTCLAWTSGMQAQVSLSAEPTPVGSSWNEEVRLCWRQSWRCPRPIHRLGPDPYGLIPWPLVHCAVEGQALQEPGSVHSTSWLCLLLAAKSPASHLTSLGLSFTVFKMDTNLPAHTEAKGKLR